MTVEQIDRIEPGRETDALVAEWVPLAGVVMESAPGEGGERRPYWRHDAAGFRERFQPTTDPEAAAAIVQWLQTACGCTVRVGPGGLCRVSRGERHIKVSAPAPELAVCKAALMVMLPLAVGAGGNAASGEVPSDPQAVESETVGESTTTASDSATSTTNPTMTRAPQGPEAPRHSSYAAPLATARSAAGS